MNTANTAAGFVSGFNAEQGRMPDKQEIWDAAIASYQRRHPLAAQAQSAVLGLKQIEDMLTFACNPKLDVETVRATVAESVLKLRIVLAAAPQPVAAPAVPVDLTQLRTVLGKRRFRTDGDPQRLVDVAASVIAEDGDIINGLQLNMDRLQAAPAVEPSDAQDAARYRWLRARPLDGCDQIYIAVHRHSVLSRWGLGGDDPDACDRAIDAALAQKGQQP